MSKRQQIIDDLNLLAAEEGITLPYTPEFIADVELRGRYVDLTTGYIGDPNESVSLTVVGEATAVVLKQDRD